MSQTHQPRGDRHFEDFRQPEKIEEGGVIRLSGAFLLDHENEIINLVNNESKLAETKNPLHRVSQINKTDGTITVQLTDHNLTLHIGKALTNAFKGEHNYKFLKEEKFIEVEWRRD